MLQKQGFLKEGTTQLTPNHPSNKNGHQCCENSIETPAHTTYLVSYLIKHFQNKNRFINWDPIVTRLKAQDRENVQKKTLMLKAKT